VNGRFARPSENHHQFAGTKLSELAKLESEQISDEEITSALADFDGVWESLQPREQARVIELLVESVVWDGEAESVSITFRSTGIKMLAGREEAA